MFGIGGGELILILFIMLMLFGADKIPEIARTIGKVMAQLKNATNDIKNEIQKSAESNGLDKTFQEMHGNFSGLSHDINSEINKAQTRILQESKEVEVPIDIESIEGPIKRKR